ncbi:MAG: glycosyltransferase family 39 protein [Gammaproteobacteria bacterium]
MHSNHFSKDQPSWIRDIAFLAVVIFLFYMCWLGSYPLFTPDEGRYSEVAREMVATGDYITPRVNGVVFLDKPVLYYWLQATAIHLFGVTEWSLRFFPAMLAVLGCLITYVTGRNLFCRKTGLLAAVILATTPLFFGGAHYADLNIEVAVFISATLFCIINALQSEGQRQRRFFLAAYVLAACAFLTKGLIGIAFPGIITLLWIAILNRWDVLKKASLGTGLIIFLVLVLPWYVLAQIANPDFLHFFFIDQQLSRFLSAQDFNNPTPIWFYAPIILVGFFPWTIFLVQALGKSIGQVISDKKEHAATLFFLLWFIVVFVFFSIPHSKTVGYIFPVFPALAMLVGRYLALRYEEPSHRAIYWAVGNFVVLSGLLGIALISLPQLHLINNVTPTLYPYLYTFAFIFIAAAILSFYCIKRKTLLPFILLCILCSVAFLLTLTKSAGHLNQNSAKPLTEYLQPILHNDDEVAAYFKFYQDVPIYLQRKITLVADWQAPDIATRDNWVREMWYGMAFQKKNDQLINEEQFWQRWNSDKRIFVFVSENYFDQFRSHTKHYFVLDRYNDIILLSNKPVI